jgi:hypothetical protein
MKNKVKCPRCGKVWKFDEKPKEIQCCVKFSVFEHKRKINEKNNRQRRKNSKENSK